MPRFVTRSIIHFACCAGLIAVPGWAQEAAEEKAPPTEALVKGRIAVEEGFPVPFDLQKLTAEVVEQVQFEPLPLPGDWVSKDAAQRQTWLEEFRVSEAGKAFAARRETQIANRRKFPISLDGEGNFEIEGVPRGSYNLFGRNDVEIEGKKFAVEVFGQFEVGEVDVLSLQSLPLTATRLLAAGEVAPSFSVDGLVEGSESTALDRFAGKPLLVHFWTAANPGSANDLSALKQCREALLGELGLEVVSICVDEDFVTAQKFVEEQQPGWPQARTGGWGHPVFAAYGLRGIPAYFLLDKTGKIALANADFYREFGQPQSQLADIVRRALTVPQKQPSQ
jgi:peroxiredoxin